MMCPRNEENTVGQLYLRNKLIENESRFVRQGGKRKEKWMKVVKRSKLPVINTKDVMYNMINVTNTSVYYM